MRRPHSRFKSALQRQNACGTYLLVKFIHRRVFFPLLSKLLHQLSFGWQCNDFRCITFCHLFFFLCFPFILVWEKTHFGCSRVLFSRWYFVLSDSLPRWCMCLCQCLISLFFSILTTVTKVCCVHPESVIIWENCIWVCVFFFCLFRGRNKLLRYLVG